MAGFMLTEALERLREENGRLVNDLSFERNLNNILENIRNNSLILCQNCKCVENENIFKVIKQFNNIYTDLKAKQNLSKFTETTEQLSIIKKNSIRSDTNCTPKRPKAIKYERPVTSDNDTADIKTDDDFKPNFSLITELLNLKKKNNENAVNNCSQEEESGDDEFEGDEFDEEDEEEGEQQQQQNQNQHPNQHQNQQQLQQVDNKDDNPIEIIECEPSFENFFGDDDDDDDEDDNEYSIDLPMPMRGIESASTTETPWALIKTEVPSDQTEQEFVCPICYKKCDKKLRLQNHLSKEHKIPGFECDLCEYKANTKYHLNRHKASHSSEKPFQCPVEGCNKWFKTKDYLYEHKKLMHTSKQRFKCHLCDYKTNCKTNFTHHQSRHSTDRPYRCPIVGCNKTFKCKKSLRTHKSPSHMRLNAMQIFECNSCTFVTNSKQKLSIHQNSHSSNSVFQCRSCGLCFTSELALDEHRRQFHHNKHYFCDFPDCGKSFSSNQYLKVHKNSHCLDNKKELQSVLN